MPFGATFIEASDQSLLVSFGAAITSVITAEAHGRVLALFQSLREDRVRGVLNLHPAYSSLLIRFNPLVLTHEDLTALVSDRLTSRTGTGKADRSTVTIPVCYNQEFGPDLADLASLHGISPKDVVELHASAVYTVYFLGFVPGFAYLGMVPEQLATPRLPVPRKQVPAGSVGIADRQTGVYPISTPGGWRLIGRTALKLFEPARPGMSLLEPGNQVKFHPISESEFHRLIPA